MIHLLVKTSSWRSWPLCTIKLGGTEPDDIGTTTTKENQVSCPYCIHFIWEGKR